MKNPVLELEGIHKHFGGVHALKGVDFNLVEGEIHALLGENGAGKSTLVKIITGVHKADSGVMKIDNNEIVINNPVEARRAGIGVIYQELSLIESLTVGENIYLGNETEFLVNGFYDRKALYKKSAEQLARFQIEIDPKMKVSKLRMGQKRILEIVKALVLDARILLLDEPTTGMSQKEIDTLFEILNLLRQQKVTMIYISHYLDEVFRICNRATVLRDGRLIDTFDVAKVKQSDLVKAMIGEVVFSGVKRDRKNFDEVPNLLELKDFQTSLMKNKISLAVKKGQIFGVTGIIGSGKSELAHSLFGDGHLLSGQIKLEGQEVKIKSSRDAKKHGLAFIPEDRKSEGLFLNSSVLTNFLVVNVDESLTKLGILDSPKIEKYSLEMGKKVKLQPLNLKMKVGNLSGGNQQKLVIGKWLLTNPKLIIMDEPTRGIDVGAKEEIYEHVRKLADSGTSVLILSSEYQELINNCDSIMVLHPSGVAGPFDPRETTGEKILSISLGVE